MHSFAFIHYSDIRVSTWNEFFASTSRLLHYNEDETMRNWLARVILVYSNYSWLIQPLQTTQSYFLLQVYLCALWLVGRIVFFRRKSSFRNISSSHDMLLPPLKSKCPLQSTDIRTTLCNISNPSIRRVSNHIFCDSQVTHLQIRHVEHWNFEVHVDRANLSSYLGCARLR